MPRPRKPARLYFRKDEGQWIIRDGTVQKRTGYGHGQRSEAETALAEYLAARALPERRGPALPGDLTVGEVLARYAEEKGPTVSAPNTLAYSIQALAPFWGNLTCDAVKGSTCRRYVRERAKPRTVEIITKTGKRRKVTRTAGAPTARRELGVLQAALNHAHEEGILAHPVKVSLPQEGEIRDRWLTRSEAARLLRAASPHVRRFILISLYSGRRHGAVLELTWDRVNLDRGTIQFRDAGTAETKKRRGRARIPRQLRGHLNRWHRQHERLPELARQHEARVVCFMGKPIASIKKGILRAAERAGLADVTPHVLKHTAITWAVMKGLEIEDAAEFFDTSPETIRKHYWHHSPFHQKRALEIVERR